MTSFSVWESQDKAKPFIDALVSAGYDYIPTPDITNRANIYEPRADILLIDYEHPNRNYVLEQADRKGVAIFVYPHSARTSWLWDGLYAPWPSLRCNFVFGEGNRKMMRAYGYSKPIEVVGWAYSPVKPFKFTSGVRVLFAPIHPNRKKGNVCEEYVKSNARAFEKLLSLVPDIELRVRYGRSIAENGLWQDEHVSEWEPAEYTRESTMQSIARADLVVAHDTFAYISVALGKPTLMFAENVQTRDEHLQLSHSFETYKHILCYPLDLNQAKDPRQLVQRAAATDADIAEWRADFIGNPFDGTRFAELVECYAKEAKPWTIS